MAKSLVSVVLPCYNTEPYIEGAVRSILNQTFQDFELIIVNDGSTDQSSKILAKLSDSRIKIIHQANQGLVASLNRGIKQATGRYIARQDADDMSEPTRLEKQISMMEANSDLAIVGTSMSVINGEGRALHKHAVLLNDPELRQELLIRSPFAHGSVMFRRDFAIQAGLYSQKFWPAEDYEFWTRLSDFGKLSNINEFLYHYRQNNEGISMKNQNLQTSMLHAVQDKVWMERHKYITRKAIDINPYKGTFMGEIRQQRIINNLRTVISKSIEARDFRFALKTMGLIRKNPSAYRKIAGSIRRKNAKT